MPGNPAVVFNKYASINKKGNFALIHALQNLYGRGSMLFPGSSGLEKLFLRGMLRPDQGMSTAAGNALYGVGRSVIPEVEIMSSKFSELGRKFEKFLAEHGVSKHDLSLRDIVALRRAMRGDFNGALNSRAPRARAAVSSFIRTVFPNAEPLFAGASGPVGKAVANGSGAVSPELAAKALHGLGRVWKENRFTGNLSRALDEKASSLAYPQMAERLGSVAIVGKLARARNKGLAQKLREASQGEDTRGRQFLRGAGDAVGNAAFLVGDPASFVVNNMKRMADAKWLRGTAAGRAVQDNLGDVFVNRPMAKSFQKGLGGAYVHPFHAERAAPEVARTYRSEGVQGVISRLAEYGRETVDSQALNPFTAAMKHLANGAGKALHDAGITQGQVSAAVRKAGNVVSLPTPKARTFSYKAMDAVSEAGNGALHGFREGIRNIPRLLSELRI